VRCMQGLCCGFVFGDIMMDGRNACVCVLCVCFYYCRTYGDSGMYIRNLTFRITEIVLGPNRCAIYILYIL
jgi:hypothetical protein